MMSIKTIEKGGVTAPQGFVAGVAKSGIKKEGRYDLALLLSKVTASAAAVFTTNKFLAAPVVLSKQHLQSGVCKGVVANSGCANACTGEKGYQDAVTMAKSAAEVAGCEAEEIVTASTGVIGVHLPMEKIIGGIKEAGANLTAANGHLAAQAIMTTDTFPKETAVQFELDGKMITIGAMAKGSGMIHPNMATMLAFITTDVAIAPAVLQKALNWANKESFAMISVDGDTSTNDSLFVLANGLAENPRIEDDNSTAYRAFRDALTEICLDLAKMIAKDGEGATKLLEVRVINAASREDAAKGAKSIVASSLVKTAVFGEDANWGRIVCALGYSGAEFIPELVDVYLGDVKVAENGCGLDFDEGAAAEVLKKDAVAIKVDLQQGECEATAWGCDLTYDYVKINGDYRT